MVVLVMGLPGSGKSYFAKKLAHAMQAAYLSSDRIRKAYFSDRRYTDREKNTVYEEMLRQMVDALAAGSNMILDATFYKEAIRKKFLTNAGESAVLIEVTAPEALIKKRLQQPREDSEADYSVYRNIKAAWEPVQEAHLVLESRNDNIEDMLDKALQYLHIKHDK